MIQRETPSQLETYSSPATHSQTAMLKSIKTQEMWRDAHVCLLSRSQSKQTDAVMQLWFGEHNCFSTKQIAANGKVCGRAELSEPFNGYVWAIKRVIGAKLIA